MTIKFLKTTLAKQLPSLSYKDTIFLNIFMGLLILGGWHCIYELPTTHAIQPDIVQKLNITAIDNGLADFQHSLQKEEERIWHDIEQAAGVTREQCMAMKQNEEWRTQYNESMQNIIEKRKSDQPLSQATKDLIQQMLSLCNIDAKNIQVISATGFSPIVTTDTILFVNDEKFSTFSDSIKKFILVHEMSHIINQDNSTRRLLLDLQADQPENEALKHATNRLKYFSETRADVFSILHGQEFAQGQIEFMGYLLKLYGDYPSSSHPSNTDRLAMGQKLLAFMEQENNAKA